MSQQEFENYLTLLTRLLKVAPSQREQLAQEFRAHLEDRLDELLAGGVERNQAVQQAISEFGDAASLAVELTEIAQRKMRRFLMKMSSASVGALTLAGLLVFALWPEGRQLQGPPVASAQGQGTSPKETEPQQPQRVVVRDGVSQAHEKIQAALDKQVEFSFIDTPLTDVVAYIQQTCGIPVVLRMGALGDAALTADTSVTFSLQGVSLRSALRLMLGEMKLAFVIQDEVLQITTREDAEGQLFTRVYDCRELLALQTPPGSSPLRAAGGGGGLFAVADEPAGKASAAGGANRRATGAAPAPGGRGLGAEAGGGTGDGPQPRELSDAEHLISLIKTTVEPDSWDEVGGPGSIAEYKGLLVVTQTGEVHERVERLLNMLHLSAGLEEQRVKVVE